MAVALSHLRTLVLICSLPLLFASCGGVTNVLPTSPSQSFALPISSTGTPSAPAPSPVPPATVPAAQTINGIVRPVNGSVTPCWADRFPCETYDFTLSKAGAIEVTLAWDGQPRALMVQLYWAGEGLAHEDIAPRTGPSRISFRRPLMEAANYRLRVVSLEPESAIPFTLSINY
jgi:hypothetical protein